MSHFPTYPSSTELLLCHFDRYLKTHSNIIFRDNVDQKKAQMKELLDSCDIDHISKLDITLIMNSYVQSGSDKVILRSSDYFIHVVRNWVKQMCFIRTQHAELMLDFVFKDIIEQTSNADEFVWMLATRFQIESFDTVVRRMGPFIQLLSNRYHVHFKSQEFLNEIDQLKPDLPFPDLDFFFNIETVLKHVDSLDMVRLAPYLRRAKFFSAFDICHHFVCHDLLLFPQNYSIIPLPNLFNEHALNTVIDGSEWLSQLPNSCLKKSLLDKFQSSMDTVSLLAKICLEYTPESPMSEKSCCSLLWWPILRLLLPYQEGFELSLEIKTSTLKLVPDTQIIDGVFSYNDGNPTHKYYPLLVEAGAQRRPLTYQSPFPVYADHKDIKKLGILLKYNVLNMCVRVKNLKAEDLNDIEAYGAFISGTQIQFGLMKVRAIDNDRSVLDFFLPSEWLIDFRQPVYIPMDVSMDELNRQLSVNAEESETLEQLEEQYKNLSLEENKPIEADTLLDISWDQLGPCFQRIQSICQKIIASTQKYCRLLDKKGIRTEDPWPSEKDALQPKSSDTQSSSTKETPLKQRLSRNIQEPKGISNVRLFGLTIAKQLAEQHGLTLLEETGTLHGDSTMSWLIKESNLILLVKNADSKEDVFYNRLSKFQVSPKLHGHLFAHGLSAYLLPRLMDIPASVSPDELFQDCFRILAVLEKEGCIHGDIKPSHLKYDPNDNQIKLIDYDISVISENGIVKSRAGTLGYRAPEVEKKSRLSHSSDVWSMGVTLKELCKNDLKKDELKRLVDAMCELDYHQRPSGTKLESLLRNIYLN